VRTDGRDSNPVTVEFTGDSRRDVMINEFLADPPDGAAGDANHDGVRDSSDDEFIELVNTTTHDIDLLGYRILTRGSSATTGTVRHQFAGGSILPACTSLVLFGGGSPDSNSSVFGGAQVYKTKTGSLSLTNSGGVITLLDDSGATVDSVAYGGASGLDGDANQSLTRAPDITGPFSLHKTASDRLFSPGTRLNGAPFALCSPISSITISPAAATIEVGQQQQFTAHAFDAVGNEVSGVLFSWEWDNVTAATLEQSGLATGNAPGTTEIRAVARGVRSASPATLTVKPASPVLTTVTLSPANATVGLGETPQFTAQANDQFGQDIGGVDISFASSDLAVASVNPSSAASATGSAIVSLTTHFNGTTEIRATATDGTHTATSSPSMLTVEPGVHELVISEFRTRGPNGAADEFVELYNPSRDTLNIGGLRLRAANGSGTVSDRVTITAGKTLDSGCHYLIANSSTGGFSGSASPDQSYATGVTDDGGLAITGSNGTRIIDAVGMSSGSAYKEGAPLAPLAGNLDQGYERKPGGSFGNGNDRDDNASDFKLTAPGNPQNSSSGCLDTSMADLSITMGAAPDPVTVGSNLTYTLTITNNGVAFARRIIVRDDLPAGVSFVSCAATGGGVCGGSGNTRRIDFASLESGASATVTLLASANGPAGATITNTATVESILPDIHKDNNSATTATVVQAPLPALSINDVAAGEGDSGTTAFRFTVSLTAPAPPGGVTFSVATADNTATSAGSDYAARSVNTQSISSGDTSSTFEVIVNGDTLVEGNETFFVNLFNVTNASVGDAQGQGTIKNDDTASLVVSQVYAGGGNSGAQFAHDFVELFNHGTTTLDFAITPYSVQYAGATAAFGSNKVDLTTGLMAPGQYFLVQLASGGANGSPLPAPDATGSIAMAATAGKVALVFGTTALSGNGCPLAANVADFAGYGTTADCFEGAGRAPAPGNTTAALRKAGGCTDTNDNAADFLISAPFPRNASSPLNNCSAGTPPNLAVNDVTVTEGNSGTTALAFTVSLSAPAPATDITFDIATHDNTATTASGDYVARSLTNQLLPAGQTSYTFTVNLNGDLASEPDESFFVNLTNVSGATVAKAQGVGTIRNDDFPSLTIDDVALAEGNSGSKLFTFTVGLSTNAPGPVTFDIATQDNSATVADNDYVARGLSSQTIPAGNSTYTFDVSVNGDTTLETNETFLVNVTNVSGATVADGVGAGTIQNDDSPALSVSDVSQSEGNSGTTAFSFTVTSSLPAPPGGITFDIATADGTAHDQVPATEDHDYVLRSLTAQTIPAGDTSYTFAVTVNGDTLVETNETFFVNLTNVTNASLADGQGQGTILNDDAPLLVISQVYGGGGNAGATYTTDFIEIFNRGVTTVDFAVTPYSVQYAAATSNFSTLKSDISSGVLLPGHYFLVQEGSGGAVGVVLPTPDATGSINLAATAGKVALVSGTTGLSGNGCPLGAVIVDFLGYGNTASCFETAPVPVSGTNSNARSLIRTASCTDNNNNATDFSNPTTAPLARNTATAPTVCP
jgi:uncharacterized repeat protein (TIGR01451 family)